MTTDDCSSYSNHREQLECAKPTEARLQALEDAIKSAFEGKIKLREIGYIQFDSISCEELGKAFHNYPIIVKCILARLNIASRAIQRDLSLSIDLYASRISLSKANILAGYIKPMLPREVAIPSLIDLDGYFWIDKELRATKGRWEAKFTTVLNENSKVVFIKRTFDYNGEIYEIDAAYPKNGSDIAIAIDVKRIESPRDIHKRSDEIINKATKFKAKYPSSKFFALVYYPFPSQHQNVISRLKSEHIDEIFFAAETDSSLSHAAILLLGAVNCLQDVETA